RRPLVRECADVYKGGDPTKNKNCDKCCKKAAHLAGMSEREILGMMLIMDKKPKCSCCAPYSAFERFLAVPVQFAAFQPPLQPPVSYQQPAYSTNNNQPTGY
ncbi:hypothetical protein COOONC_17091, partial [Cooperia oncophora]